MEGTDVTALEQQNCKLQRQVEELKIELESYRKELEGIQRLVANQFAANDERSQELHQKLIDARNIYVVDMEKLNCENEALRRENEARWASNIAQRRENEELRRENDEKLNAVVHDFDMTIFDLLDRNAALQKERALRNKAEYYRKIDERQLLTWLLAMMLPIRQPWLLLRAARIASSMLLSVDKAAADKAAADQAAAEKAAADKEAADQAAAEKAAAEKAATDQAAADQAAAEKAAAEKAATDQAAAEKAAAEKAAAEKAATDQAAAEKEAAEKEAAEKAAAEKEAAKKADDECVLTFSEDGFTICLYLN